MMNDNDQKKMDTDQLCEGEISMENLTTEEKIFLEYIRMLPERELEEIENLLRAMVREKLIR